MENVNRLGPVLAVGLVQVILQGSIKGCAYEVVLRLSKGGAPICYCGYVEVPPHKRAMKVISGAGFSRPVGESASYRRGVVYGEIAHSLNQDKAIDTLLGCLESYVA